MTEPSASFEPSQPFANRPSEPTGGGCSKPALIGCGLLILILGLGALFFMMKAKDLFSWVLVQVEEEVLRALPEDLDQDARERLSVAFAAASEAVVDGTADPLALQDLQPKIMEAAQSASEGMTREEVLELTLALEAVAGIESSPEVQEPNRPPPETSPGEGLGDPLTRELQPVDV